MASWWPVARTPEQEIQGARQNAVDALSDDVDRIECLVEEFEQHEFSSKSVQELEQVYAKLDNILKEIRNINATDNSSRAT